jgi:hypothetical protein
MPFLTAALLALIGGWCVPSTARAGCGDDVGSLNEMKGDAGPFHKRAKTSPIHWKQTSSDHKAPCDGPACSSGQSPLMPVVPPVPPPSPEWLYFSAGLFLTEPTDPRLLLEARLFIPSQRASDIFHPPRVAPTWALA